VARERKFQLHNGKTGSAITVQIITQAKQDEIAEILKDGTLRIRLAVPEDESKINQALIRFLAEVMGVKSEAIEIIGGQNRQDKLVAILNLDAMMMQDKILSQM